MRFAGLTVCFNLNVIYIVRLLLAYCQYMDLCPKVVCDHYYVCLINLKRTVKEMLTVKQDRDIAVNDVYV
jgi:hypothetical protein